MGLLSSFCRAVGRAVGRGVETVGKIIHSEKTQEVGRKIQDACRETAVSTGRQREYDQEYRQQSGRHGRLRIFCRAFHLV